MSKLEYNGLKDHGLNIGTPSQLSDAFRQGIRYVLSNMKEPEVPNGKFTTALQKLLHRVIHDVFVADNPDDLSLALCARDEYLKSIWQPIETAPKETEVFIGRFIDGVFKFGRSEMFYEQANEFEGETFSGWVWSEDECSSSVAENPTHWMLIPKPPKEYTNEN